MIKRIGFACKWIDNPNQTDGIKSSDDCKKYNTGTTTVAWLNRQSKSKAEEKLWDLMKGNIESVKKLVTRVGNLNQHLRMVRLSSDILPVYTESNWRYFWKLPDVQQYAERHFAEVGRIARDRNVRLSFHPGQFTVLASDNPDIVNKSIEEFEYHADMARWMGFGKQFQDIKINVHISGKEGPEGIRRAYKRLSPEARNSITIENEENSWGLDECLTLGDLLPIVLDIHHNYCREGEYISSNDPRIKMIINSWRGLRPVMHYSQSREEFLSDHPTDILPSRDVLIDRGINKQKLRAHSDYMHNLAMNLWAKTHWEWADVMVEAKAKNLASFKLFEYWESLKM
jgi:UV damage endonuclease UvdE